MDLREQTKYCMPHDDYGEALVISLELVMFRDPRTWLAEILSALREAEPYVAFHLMRPALVVPLWVRKRCP